MTIDTETAVETPAATDAVTNESAEAQSTPQTTESAITYEAFTLPEGMAMDQDMLDQYTPLFQKAGLSQEDAQKYIDDYVGKMTANMEGSEQVFTEMYEKKRAADVATQSEAWLTQLKSDKELGGANFESVRARVLEAVASKGSPELKQAFNDLGLGNHPEIVRFINAMAKGYQPQDRGETQAGAGGVNNTIANTLYPNMNP